MLRPNADEEESEGDNEDEYDDNGGNDGGARRWTDRMMDARCDRRNGWWLLALEDGARGSSVLPAS